MVKLRDYQEECIKAITSIERGSGLVSMATGLGKTVIFSHIPRRGKVLIISHREELVRQPIKFYDCKCGIEQGAHTSSGEEVVSASVQTLTRRLEKFRPDEFDVIITDEAHHAAAPSYKKIYDYFKPRLHIGFTATPNRGDKVRLDDIFEKIVFERDLRWGIAHGWLTDIRCLRVRVSYDVRSVRRHLGDFASGELDRAVNNPTANDEVAEVYKKYAHGQTLIFATSVSHAENIAAKIDGAIAVSEKTADRKAIIDKFTRREIPCIVNCMIFTEGTDLPLIETIIIARPTANQSLYAQMVGRGLRRAEGKQYLTLIDCVGVTDKLEICTAPSLVGLDLGEVPDYRRDRIEGMLTDMEQIVGDALDSPESWIMNVQAVNLFAESQGVSTHKINWTKKPNGDLVYQFASGDRIGVKAMNELGKTRVLYYVYNETTKKFEYKTSDEMSLADALHTAYRHFEDCHADERKFWDLENYYDWQYQAASEKQLDYIKSKLDGEEWSQLTSRRELTKGDAAQIINMLKIRNLRPADLLRMRKNAVEKRRAEEAERELMSKLKIRLELDKTRKTAKYYAIKHPTDLVITNSWDKAAEIIAELDKSGVKCKYKGFFTLDDASNFLRN